MDFVPIFLVELDICKTLDTNFSGYETIYKDNGKTIHSNYLMVFLRVQAFHAFLFT